MLKACYSYIFIRLLNYYTLRGKTTMPWLYASQNIALAQLANLSSIAILLKIPNLFSETIIIISASIIFILLIVLNVKLFHRTDVLKRINNITESDSLRFKRTISIWLYFISSYAIFFYLFIPKK